MEQKPAENAGHRSWAHFRFAIVGSLLAAPPEKVGEAITELAGRTWQHPTRPERQLRFGFSTIERWYYEAKRAADPVGKLTRRIRKDAGTEKALSAALAEELGRQYGTHPSWSYRLHVDNLAVIAASDPVKYGEMPSYPTVRRAMHRRGWKRRQMPRRPTAGQKRSIDWHERREQRGYEASAVHALWHLDFHQGSLRVVDGRGEWATPHMMAVIDDRSRLCCHGQWYLAETAENLVHALIQAILKRGLPRAQMHDNGAAMVAWETQNGLKELGIVSQPTVPYSPEQNAKLEVFWAQVEGRLMKLVEKIQPLTLEFLNKATAAWIEGDYNHGLHEEIRTTPVKRMMEGPDVSRPAPDLSVLRRQFAIEETRTQREGDGTVSIKGIRFELPSRLRTLARPTVRYQHWDLTRAWVVDPTTKLLLAEIRPIDKEKNALRGRRLREPVAGHVPVPPPAEDPIPPLLHKLLRDYAASGLPPAYLPKDEVASDEESSND